MEQDVKRLYSTGGSSRRHYNDRGGEIIRTPQHCNTHARNDAPTSDNRVRQSHNSWEEEQEEEEEEE